MNRLAEYFAIIGFKHNDLSTKSMGSTTEPVVERAEVLCRVPRRDHEGMAFPHSIEVFCQPAGWFLLLGDTLPEDRAPTFHIAQLTDECGSHLFQAVLSFYEPLFISKLDDGSAIGSLVSDCADHMKTFSHSLNPAPDLYCPKSLVLISRHRHIDVLRNCLQTIYTSYCEQSRNVQIEKIITNVLACAHVPSPGGPSIQLHLGAGDRQTLTPPRSDTIPVTGTSVFKLLDRLGVNNVMSIFYGILTDYKVILLSRSYIYMENACHGLVSLLYPLTYIHTYIPVLPAELIDIVSSPTPYIIGIHSTLREKVMQTLSEMQTEERAGLIIVELDGGCIHTDTDSSILQPNERLNKQTHYLLTKAMSPELITADMAFAPDSSLYVAPALKDKRIRAVFVRFFAETLINYRHALNVIRISPTPVVVFNKAEFFGARNQYANLSDLFTTKIVESILFQNFIQHQHGQNRGAPYRYVDLFDEVIAKLPSQLITEAAHPNRIDECINSIVNSLWDNESPEPSTTRTTPAPRQQPSHFPDLDVKAIDAMMDNVNEKLQPSVSLVDSARVLAQRKVVPMGGFKAELLPITKFTRQNAVLKNCLDNIFDNKISEAVRSYEGAKRGLRLKQVVWFLCEYLGEKSVLSERCLLNDQQFDLLSQLIKSALKTDSLLDEDEIASKLIKHLCDFYRTVGNGYQQFLYTAVQEPDRDDVWKSQVFWVSAFQKALQSEICKIYAPPQPRTLAEGNSLLDNAAALQLSASFLQADHSDDFIKKHAKEEIDLVVGLAKHFAQYIMNMIAPLDKHQKLGEVLRVGAQRFAYQERYDQDDDSAIMSDGVEHDILENTEVIGRFIGQFLEKVSLDSALSPEVIETLKNQLSPLIMTHLEHLDQQHRYVKAKEKDQLMPKPKVKLPALYPGECQISGFRTTCRACLQVDGRDERVYYHCGQTADNRIPSKPALVPAEGAVFLTSYRVIFVGYPSDEFIVDQADLRLRIFSNRAVVRSIPLKSIKSAMKKKERGEYVAQFSIYFGEVLQLRSRNFDFMKLMFDTNDTTLEDIEKLRSEIEDMRQIRVLTPRSSPSPGGGMEVGGSSSFYPRNPPSTKGKKKGKNRRSSRESDSRVSESGAKGAMKTLQGTLLRKSGKDEKKAAKPVTINITAAATTPIDDRDSILTLEEHGTLRAEDMHTSVHITLGTTNPSQAPERYRSLCEDYLHSGLISSSLLNGDLVPGKTCLLHLNGNFSLCDSYPPLLVMPASFCCDSNRLRSSNGLSTMRPSNTAMDRTKLQKLAKMYKSTRFPAITYKHKETGALLVRAAAVTAKSLSNFLMSTGGKTAASPANEQDEDQVEPDNANTRESIQREYLRELVRLSPLGRADSTSTLSADRCPDSPPRGGTLGDRGRRKDRGFSTLDPRSTRRRTGSNTPAQGRKIGFKLGGGGIMGAFTGNSSRNNPPSVPAPSHQSGPTTSSSVENLSSLTDTHSASINSDENFPSSRAPLTVVTDRAHYKNLKCDSHCEFMLVDLPDSVAVRGAAKKMLQKCFCPAGNSRGKEQPGLADNEFLKLLHDSRWLHYISSILHVSIAIAELLMTLRVSVLVTLESGSDVTCQLTSLAQLIAEPRYRTFAGFQQLVEKEWLSFGHSFSSRHVLVQGTQVPGAYTPIFLQFLDCVHQLYHQCEEAFEFNDYYLQFLAYHILSNRFNTFRGDSELDRQETESQDTLGSIWNYIEMKNVESTIFANFLYDPSGSAGPLYPLWSVSHLDPWDYYTGPPLATGPIYDLDILEASLEGELRPELRTHMSQFLDAEYDPLKFCCVDGVDVALARVGVPTLGEWSRIENNSGENPANFEHWSPQVREHVQRSLVLELLRRQRYAGPQLAEHNFIEEAFTSHTTCDVCGAVLFGFNKRGLRCQVCGFSCHIQCQERVSTTCKSHETVERPPSTVRHITGDNEDTMEKQGRYFTSGWGEVHVVFDHSRNEMRYNRTVPGAETKVIQLGQVCGCEAAQSDDGYHYSWSVTMKGGGARQYLFRCSSEKMRAKWVSKVKTAIAK